MRRALVWVSIVVAGCGDDGASNRPPEIAGAQITTAEDTAVMHMLSPTDPEGATVTIRVSNPDHGTVTLGGNRLTYTPAANYHGTDSLLVTVSDGALEGNATLDLTVTSVNDAPVAGADSFAGAEDTVLNLGAGTLLANDTDVDGDTLTVTSVTNPSNGTVTMVGTDVRFTPALDFSGNASFDYAVSDGTASVTGTVAIAVALANDPPVAVDDTRTVAEDTALAITGASLVANDTDPEAQTLTVTAVASPTNGTVALAGGTVTFTPTANFFGTATFQYTVSDGSGTDTGVVTVTVTAVNDAPVAVDDTRTTAEDTALAVTAASLVANDTDVEGSALTVTAVGNPTNGTVVLAGGTATFTPAANFSGTGSFDYTVSDGALTDTGTVTVTITAVNDAPVAVADARTTAEDTALVATGASLVANDTDVEGSTLTVTAVGSPVNGTVTLTGGNVTFTPTANFFGMATFQYTVSDGALTSVGLVTVTVTPVNDAPVAVADSRTTAEDTPLAIATTTLTANDTDVDGPALTVTAVGTAVNGSVVLAGGTATFTPAANFAGAASFQYTVSDGTLTSVGTVTVTVTAVNDAPVAVDDTAAVQSNSSVDIPFATLLANDTDIDGPALTVASVQNATDGTATLGATAVTFTPTAGFAGTATFEYVVSDGTLTDVGLVTVTVSLGAACGDGVIVSPETCDDGDTSGGDGCDATCQTEPGYTCTGQPSVCAPDCGDTVVIAPEQCDDGNTIEEDGCTSACVTGVVCNATQYPGGDRFAVDPATGHCYVSFDDDLETFAQAEAACVGTGGYLATITSGTEDAVVHAVQNLAQNPWIGAVDDANDTDAIFDWVTDETFVFTHFAPGQPDDDILVGGNGECLHLVNASSEWNDTNCTISTFVVGKICEVEPAACGDSIAQVFNGEECDDGNTAAGDGCSATCQLENGCGNGTIGAGEECDDDNTVSGDGCSATCQVEDGCGDGNLDTGEQCDDDNVNGSDGCSSTCQIEPGAVCTATAPTLCSKLVINEIDYDNTGTDNTGGQFEFVEIVNAGTGAADLTNIALVEINGGVTPPAEYFFDASTGIGNVAKRIKLTSAAVPGNSLAPGAMIVIGPAGLTSTVPAGVFVITLTVPAAGWIQNGPPDAIALFDLVTPGVVDALGYEGAVTGVTVLGITGTFSFTEGAANVTGDTGTLNQSLVRRNPNAHDTQNNATDFTLATPSPGLANP